MENTQHIKSLNTDSRSKNRIKYTSAKQRAKRASADVYRSYKRRIGVTNAASREERVHHPYQEESSRHLKRQRISGTRSNSNDKNKVAIVSVGRGNDVVADDDTQTSDLELEVESTFANELDVANDRNGSELFGRFYREIWPLVRSLPEILHHTPTIIKLLMTYLLSPETEPSMSSNPENYSIDNPKIDTTSNRENFVINHASADILHLIAVLARDLRHEIHPYVHTLIVPRIIYDLLNPPPPPPDSGRQPIPLDVTIVEASFRALSYVFRYDSESLLMETENNDKEPCLEKMRQYYGITLGHRRDYIRRLAAETFAPLVRKMKSDSARRKHLKRVIRALAIATAPGGSNSQQSPAQKRAQSDAVDGVAFLLFQVAKGITGRLHSKGNLVLRCVLDCMVDTETTAKSKRKSQNSNLERHKKNVIHEISSEFLEKICKHLDRQSFREVWKEIFHSALTLVSSLVEQSTSTEREDQASRVYCDRACYTTSKMLQLINQCVLSRGGHFVKEDVNRVNGDYINNLLRILQDLLEVEVFFFLSVETQNSVLKLLCTSWSTTPDQPHFASRLSNVLPKLLDVKTFLGEKNNKVNEAQSNVAQLLAEHLLPFLPRETAMKYVGPVILVAAAGQVEYDRIVSLRLLHSVATVQITHQCSGGAQGAFDDDDDRTFFAENAYNCRVSVATQKTLLDLCLVDYSIDKESVSREELIHLGFAARCIPFLAVLVSGHEADDGKQEDVTAVKRMMKWFRTTTENLDKDAVTYNKSKTCAKLTEVDFIVVRAAILESFAATAIEFSKGIKNKEPIEKALRRSRSSTMKFLSLNPNSIWAMKSGAAIVQALKVFKISLEDSQDDTFDALIPNLRNECHFLRLHTLQILNGYPKKNFVVDHADLDFTDDLDEEPSVSAKVVQGTDGTLSRTKNSVGVSGLCDIMPTLLELETTAVNFENERPLQSFMTRVEVLGRSGKLPVVYAEAAANHMMGILHTKFSPIWSAAVKTLIGLASAYDECLWPSLEAMLKTVILPPDSIRSFRSNPNTRVMADCEEYHNMCISWEKSGGRDSSLFGSRASRAERDGRVSRYHCTDSLTVCELLWSVMEGISEIVAKKSKTVVPIFLSFLHLQYYLFHESDPDAKELQLHEHIDQEISWTRDSLSRKMLQSKLASILKVFAAINGPRQLFKHELLLSIFSAFLSHQDAGVAQLALSCILKFKLPHVNPYADYLKGMLKKGELREALVKFDLSLESEIVDSEHRSKLIPLVSRILFGRLTARVSGGKSSKDTPAARRAAVLSFLSVLGDTDHELDSFVYLMVRSFVPLKYPLISAERRSGADRRKLVIALESVQAKDISHLQGQRYEGYLNLLSDVISQLGYGVKNYVSSFLAIILALCDFAEVRKKDEEAGALSLGGDSHNDIATLASQNFVRIGNVRTLCFRRLGELLVKFAYSVDFTNYQEKIWRATTSSINMLPGTVVNAENTPSILSLLVAISSHRQLIPLLSEHPEAIRAVIMCISKTSKAQVIDASLSFVDNLLTNGEPDCSDTVESYTIADSIGAQLIAKHVPLLLQQFTLRLEHSINSDDELDSRIISKRKAPKFPVMSKTTQRELAILCRVSDLIIYHEESISGDGKAELETPKILETLCDLLIPFLSHEQRASEDDQLNVIGTLESILPRIGSDAAMSHVPALSRALGPFKGKSGFTSLDLRKRLTALITGIAECGGVCSNLKVVSIVLTKLCATHKTRVDEVDYDQLIPALSDLGEIKNNADGWQHLSSATSQYLEVTLAPLLYTCFHLLFNDDGVVCRAAFKALKTLITHAALQATSERDENTSSDENVRKSQWIVLSEKHVVPCIRSGLNVNSQSVRRYHILLLAEVSHCFRDFSSPNLYGDLNCLVQHDNPDLDFFVNFTHVQIHRRSRALQRLRKVLDSESESTGQSIFSMQSLSNVLLPLATHPIYECNTKNEEIFALEAIALVGTIAKSLSWSKYHSALWTALSQFPRHPEQERYLVGLICALIDGFHFQLLPSESTCEYPQSTEPCGPSSTQQGSAVWRALEKRIIPKVEDYLTKEKVQRHGTKVKTLRSAVVLALLKLFQKFPVRIFESKLPRLLAVICDALKNKDSDARDVARATISKMCVELDMKYLSDVIRELAVTLTVGYKLHVRAATLHSILLELSRVHKQPSGITEDNYVPLPFDQCVPAMMDLVQQDLFGEATERKEAEGAQKRLVKEAGGAKSLDSVVLICKMIVFRPSAAANRDTSRTNYAESAIHAVVSPLLERLRNPDIKAATIGKIREVLNRVVVGLTQNSSVEALEVFPFVYASVEPFVGAHHHNSSEVEDIEDSDDENAMKPISISRTFSNNKGNSENLKEDETRAEGKKRHSSNVVEWRPSTLKSAKSDKDALEMQRKEKRDLRMTQDGASAPKLTGSSRHIPIKYSSTQSLNDPASISAVVFGLKLLYSFLKKMKHGKCDPQTLSMMDPFIQILTKCVSVCRDNDVVLLSLRCLSFLLRADLPSVHLCSAELGTKALDILTSSGSIANLHQELTQSCFKTLTLLINLGKASMGTVDESRTEQGSPGKASMELMTALPLDTEQMQVLISLLQAAVVESDQHNPTLGLIKAITSANFVSPEFYDLMETLLKLSVRSHKPTVRQQSCQVFMQYLMEYPMGKDRLEGHLKQMVLNIKYEYEEGRLSAIGLINVVIDKLPVPLLNEHAQLMFLPLVLQLVNDDSKECRQAVAKCLGRLLNRASTEVVLSFYDYAVRWSEGKGQLKRTSLQLFGIFVDSRLDVLKKGCTVDELIRRIFSNLALSTEDQDDWEVVYFSLVCLEKMNVHFSSTIARESDLWLTIARCLAHRHPWVKKVSSRMIGAHLTTLNPISFVDDGSASFLREKPGALFEVTRNFCTQLNVDEEEQNEELSGAAIKSLTWMVQAMNKYPKLCFREDIEQGKDPISWLMTRLSNIAKPKGGRRREAVYKCFAALSEYGGSSVVTPFLELMLEPLNRSITESANKMEQSSGSRRVPEASEETNLAAEVMQLLEDICGTEAFVKAFASVKDKARDKREQRKRDEATEAIRDPQAAAVRKIKKHERERNRRKRKVEEHRSKRGATAKRRH